jgi:molybdopterin molybdotransferase
MLTLSEAQQAICSSIQRATETEIVPLHQANNRFTAYTITAQVANPAFDNSAMDGYACSLADLEHGDYVLPLQGESSCGMAPGTLRAGTAMRIFTGAPLPGGADVVEIQENVRLENSQVHFLENGIRIGQNIRLQGEDFKAGEILYSQGHFLQPTDVALLAAAGVAKVPVYRRLRALVIATGDELVAPGKALKPGQIYESNKIGTLLQLAQLGVKAVDGGTVKDDPGALRERLAAAMEYDFVITSGGASVGDHDLVKQVFSEIGSINLWRVRIKPGKPVAFGRVGERTHFFALPGNPMSSLVTFKLFVEPAIWIWHHSLHRQLELNAIATNDFQRKPGRMEFLRAQLSCQDGQLMAETLPGQNSHMIGTIRQTNGLVKMREDCSGFKQGEIVTAIPLQLDLN